MSSYHISLGFFNKDPYHIDHNLLDLESEDDGPNEAENESRIAVHDILRADTLQSDLVS